MNQKINTTMLILARESRGLTQKELAQITGLTQYNISRYEAGLVPIPEKDFPLFVQALRYPPSFFNQQNRPQPSDLFYRKQKGVSGKLLHKIEAQMNIRRLHFEILSKSISIDTKKSFFSPENFIQRDPEEVANYLRYAWEIPMGPVNNLIELIEAAGGIVIPFDFETLEIDAVSLRWGTNPIFFINDRIPLGHGDRLRFTLAHEIGHIVLHSNGGINTEEEKEAHKFASAFLLPEMDLKLDFPAHLTINNLAILKTKWKVSMAAIVMWAANKKMISKYEQRKFFIRFSEWGFRKNEPVPIQHETPTLYKKIFNFFRTNLGYTIDELCQILHIFDKDELNTYYFPEKKPDCIIKLSNLFNAKEGLNKQSY